MMKKWMMIVVALGLLGGTMSAAVNPQVKFHTSAGDFVVELYPKKAPKTVANFLTYVKEGFYNGVIFHRVIPGFMVQGGGFTSDMHQKETRDPIVNEADNGLANEVGTIAMARTADPDSATAQFFINVANNTFLNFKNPTPSGIGYAVFGKVIKGYDVVEKISHVKTTTFGPFGDVPAEDVTILSVTEVPSKRVSEKP
jgi:cyclophilin family peptidyl-prolyl cis-trans isomerase